MELSTDPSVGYGDTERFYDTYTSENEQQRTMMNDESSDDILHEKRVLIIINSRSLNIMVCEISADFATGISSIVRTVASTLRLLQQAVFTCQRQFWPGYYAAGARHRPRPLQRNTEDTDIMQCQRRQIRMQWVSDGLRISFIFHNRLLV